MNEEEKIIPVTDREYTISELTVEYRKINEDLIAAVKIFTKIHETGRVNEEDYNNLTKLDLKFIYLKLKEEEIKIHGHSIKLNILNSIFSDTVSLVQKLFKSKDYCFWSPVQNEVVKIIIKNGVYVSEMLLLFNSFSDSVVEICQSTEDEIDEGFLEFDDFYISSPSKFETTLSKLESIKNTSEKINYLNNEIIKNELICLKYPENSKSSSDEQEYILKCKQAVKIISRELPQEVNQLPVAEMSKEEIVLPEQLADNSKNPDFTTARQVLAIYYLLNAIDHKAFNQTDRTEKARFIEFLTCKNSKNIYKALSDLFKGLENTQNNKKRKDLEYIKKYFEKLNLQSIVNQIDKDIKG